MNPVIAKTRAEAKAMGLGIYHTGNTCPKGHNDGRYASGGQCITCTLLRRLEALKDRDAERARSKVWRDKNIEKINARRRAYHQENIERERARRRADNKKHFAKRSETSRRYKAENIERVRETMMIWRSSNAEHIREYNRHNRDRVSARAAIRRARILLAMPGWVTQEEKKQMREIYRKARQLSDVTGVPHEVDHIIPLQGDIVSGLHVIGNLRITTRSDNRSKKNRFSPEMLEAS